MTPLPTAYVLLFALTVVVMVHQGRAKRLADHSHDEWHSSVVLGLAHAGAMISGALFPWLALGMLPIGQATAWVAVGVMVLAFALQLWSMRTLGLLFTASLQAATDQPVVARGPYRVVRHPAYLAQLVFWISFAVASRNLITILVVTSLVVLAYGHRIRTEERMLARSLGERYRAYAAGRARLVPGLW